jgi:rhodanese-related sulfurtransferase
MRKFAVLIALSAVLLTGCSNGNESAMTLDAVAFEAKTQEAGVVILDVRTKAEFDEGHIANAININVEGNEFLSEISKLDKSKSVKFSIQFFTSAQLQVPHEPPPTTIKAVIGNTFSAPFNIS